MSELVNYTEEEKQKAIQSLLKRREHKVEKATYDRQHYQEHKVEIAEQHQQYNQEHESEKVEYNLQYNQSNRDRIAEQQRRHYQEHKDEMRKQQQQYYQEHPEVSKAAMHKRRAQIASSEGHFTAEEFRTLCEVYEGKCFYCKQVLPLTPDHVVPISKGGSNKIENIIPACRSCNARKGTKTFDEFVRENLE